MLRPGAAHPGRRGQACRQQLQRTPSQLLRSTVLHSVSVNLSLHITCSPITKAAIT